MLLFFVLITLVVGVLGGVVGGYLAFVMRKKI